MDGSVFKDPKSGVVTSHISDYFIQNILQNDNNEEFDFSMEQIVYLCNIEPGNCQNLLDSLTVSIDKSKNRKPSNFKIISPLIGFPSDWLHFLQFLQNLVLKLQKLLELVHSLYQ